jgi:hypothetical protein
MPALLVNTDHNARTHLLELVSLAHPENTNLLLARGIFCANHLLPAALDNI